MTEWVTIEHVQLRGGPRDGDQINDVGAAGLTDVITTSTDGGSTCRYRKSEEYSQLRGVDMDQPFARIWVYDWVPDRDDDR